MKVTTATLSSRVTPLFKPGSSRVIMRNTTGAAVKADTPQTISLPQLIMSQWDLIKKSNENNILLVLYTPDTPAQQRQKLLKDEPRYLIPENAQEVAILVRKGYKKPHLWHQHTADQRFNQHQQDIEIDNIRDYYNDDSDDDDDDDHIVVAQQLDFSSIDGAPRRAAVTHPTDATLNDMAFNPNRTPTATSALITQASHALPEASEKAIGAVVALYLASAHLPNILRALLMGSCGIAVFASQYWVQKWFVANKAAVLRDFYIENGTDTIPTYQDEPVTIASNNAQHHTQLSIIHRFAIAAAALLSALGEGLLMAVGVSFVANNPLIFVLAGITRFAKVLISDSASAFNRFYLNHGIDKIITDNSFLKGFIHIVLNPIPLLWLIKKRFNTFQGLVHGAAVMKLDTLLLPLIDHISGSSFSPALSQAGMGPVGMLIPTMLALFTALSFGIKSKRFAGQLVGLILAGIYNTLIAKMSAYAFAATSIMIPFAAMALLAYCGEARAQYYDLSIIENNLSGMSIMPKGWLISAAKIITPTCVTNISCCSIPQKVKSQAESFTHYLLNGFLLDHIANQHGLNTDRTVKYSKAAGNTALLAIGITEGLARLQPLAPYFQTTSPARLVLLVVGLAWGAKAGITQYNARREAVVASHGGHYINSTAHNFSQAMSARFFHSDAARQALTQSDRPYGHNYGAASGPDTHPGIELDNIYSQSELSIVRPERHTGCCPCW